MEKSVLYISCHLKDSFIFNGKLHTGFYDGSYRKLIKQNIKNIEGKTSLNSGLENHFEIMDFSQTTHLRIGLSIPNRYDAEMFKEIVIREINKNPSVELISQIFLSSSPKVRENFFSKDWRGMNQSSSSL